MYTFNLFCFGHELALDKDLNNELEEMISYHIKIKGKTWEIDFPYHGGRVAGDIMPCVFGRIITDDDHNPLFLDEVRNSKESDYMEDYNIFITNLYKDLDEDLKMDPSFEEFYNRLKKFINENKPKFYLVEVSS